MNNLTSSTLPAATVTAVVLYEKTADAARVLETIHAVRRDQETRPELDLRLVQWDRLKHPDYRRFASLATAHPDVLLLGLSGTASVPVFVQTWLLDWIRQPDRTPRAVGAFFDVQTSSVSVALNTYIFLGKLTRESGARLILSRAGLRRSQVLAPARGDVAAPGRPAMELPVAERELLGRALLAA